VAAFVRQPTWTQQALAAEVGIEVRAARRHMLELLAEGLPVERSWDEDGRTEVVWTLRLAVRRGRTARVTDVSRPTRSAAPRRTVRT
jgi:predicted ArsR family transcriptional regulator